jgi:hypothetical protein
MSSFTAPTKTALGIDELRHRTRRLSQRHRTVLLLVDGQRSLAEVLALAQQAGAAISHFEELMKLGLVELQLPALTPASEAMPGSAEDTGAAEVTSVDLMVVDPEPVSAAAAPVELAPPVESAPLVEPAPPAAPTPQALPVLDAELPSAEQAWERTIRLLGMSLVPEPPVASMVTAAMAPVPGAIPAAALAAADPGPGVEPIPVPMKPPRARPRGTLPVLNDVDEGAMLQQVRDLLIDTLRLDAPLFGARTFVRVRAAQNAAELIDLVWEIEQHLSHIRHSRRELLSLQRARELLGLGNTLVADETYPGSQQS